MSFDETTIHIPSSRSRMEGFKSGRSMTMTDEHHSYTVKIFVNHFNPEHEKDKLTFEVHKRNTVEELIRMLLSSMDKKSKDPEDFEIYEVMGTLDGQSCKERRLDFSEYPVAVELLWPKSLPTGPDDTTTLTEYRFVFRQKGFHPKDSSSGAFSSTIDTFLTKFLQQPKDKEYPDLCMLPELTEQTLLENLRDRFNSGHIYTYIGPILVAMNPFKFYPIYNPKYAKLYENRRLGSLPPHIFAIADANYHNMLRTKQNQCIVISGESGSGKTESTNFLLHHLTTLSQKGTAATTLEQTLLCAGPVLEAFGNAVTAQNNNSSRFGKFIQVNYRENGMVSGANVQIYLLEKSRITSQAMGERNYHVFYYLLEGASEIEKEDLFLFEPKEYHYLNKNDFYKTEGVDEVYEFGRLCQSMELVGFGDESQRKIFSVLSAVLLLGNVRYVKRPGYHSDDNAHIANEELVGIISRLLEVRVENLLPALTTRKTIMKNDTVITRYKVSEAINTRDAMAKCLYNALFHWIVLRVNQALLKRDISGLQKGYYIGILDIFGFEDVGSQWNSFEQFCINYANERLQAYFNQHIFQFEQEEYLNQGIPWTNIEFTDNTECLHLIQSKPYGLFSLIDEESSIAKGTDESLLEKLNQFHKMNEYYEAPQKKELAFIIAHYAGKVKYQAMGFREKNKDLMRQDVVNALKNSKSSFVRELVGSDPVAVFRWAVVRASFRALSAFREAGTHMRKAESISDLPEETKGQPEEHRRGSESQLNAFLRGELTTEHMPSFCDTSVFSTIVQHVRKKGPTKRQSQSSLRGLQALKALVGKRPQQRQSKKHQSVGAQFRSSLNRLMDTLSHATPYFIRCVRSNNEKIPYLFDEDIILRQLRYTGMLETVRIRRAGYSVRIDYDEFAQQYRILLPKERDSDQHDIEEFVINHSVIDRANVQFGHSKLFMRDAEKLLLDDQLHRTIMTHIIRLQGWFRTVTARRRFIRARNGMIKMQALVRGALARQHLRHEALAALCVQTYWRSYYLHKNYCQLKSRTVQFQAFCRGFLFRQRFNKERNGFTTVDRDVRKPSPRLFEINTFFQTFKLPSFDVTSFSTTADELDREDEDESTSAEEIDEGSIKEDLQKVPLKRAPSLEAEFVLEDSKLRLVGKTLPEDWQQPAQHRRQSLATASSNESKTQANKIRLMRRAASTDSNDILGIRNGEKDEIKQKEDENASPQSPSQKGKKKSGFFKAKKHIKAFLARKSESLQSESDEDVNNSKMSSSPPAGKKQRNFSLWGDRSISPPDQQHNLKLSRIHKNEPCALCQKNCTGILRAQAYKCVVCKQCFHKECAQFAPKIPCAFFQDTALPSPAHAVKTKRPWDVSTFIKHPRQSLSPLESQVNAEKASFSLTRAKQQADPTDQILASIDDLRQFSVFIFKKQSELALANVKKRDTMVDAIFKKSLREFHTELISYEASLKEDNKTGLKYRELITIFEGSLSKVCVQEQLTFPVTLGVNAFRGFLNEFVQQQLKRKGSKTKLKGKVSLRKKRRKSDVTVMHLGHRFKADIVHVPTYCEVCNQFMWHAEKIFICMGCRISCHKKCHSKLNEPCTSISSDSSLAGGRIFGVELTRLVDDDCPVPPVIENVLLSIELRGLFIEGIYRKCGNVSQVKQLRKAIETSLEVEKICFDDTPVHVLCTLLKSFFREMASPLLTFELYENFLNVSEIDQPHERLRCLYIMVELLPKQNKALMDRLMYHLARVAHQEEVNKMGASNLAVIFAPCLLRRAQTVNAQDQLQDVQRQSVCVEALVQEKLRQYRSTMKEIVQLEQATETCEENLRKIDDHVRNASPDVETADSSRKEMEQARQLFVEQLEYLDKEKDKLIEDLPPLAPVASSEDDCLTSSDEATPHMHRKGTVKRRGSRQEEYAIDLNNPPLFHVLQHPTKGRAPRPKNQRKPSATFIQTNLQDA